MLQDSIHAVEDAESWLARLEQPIEESPAELIRDIAWRAQLRLCPPSDVDAENQDRGAGVLLNFSPPLGMQTE